MRKHEGYDEVKNVETNETVKSEPSKETPKKVLKPRNVPSFLQE